MRIVNHLNSSFAVENRDQYIFRIESIVGVLKSTLLVDDADLIKVVRVLLDEEIFLPAEVVEVDSQEIEDDVLYMTRNRSLGTLNRLLTGTLIRVAEVDTTENEYLNLETEIVKIAASFG